MPCWVNWSVLDKLLSGISIASLNVYLFSQCQPCFLWSYQMPWKNAIGDFELVCFDNIIFRSCTAKTIRCWFISVYFCNRESLPELNTTDAFGWKKGLHVNKEKLKYPRASNFVSIFFLNLKW